MKRTDGINVIECERSDNILNVTLNASQYKYIAILQYKPFLAAEGVYLQGKIEKSSEKKLELSYEIPKFAKSLSDISKHTDMIYQLEVARKLSLLEIFVDAVNPPFIHPDNIFLVSNSMVIAHRGMLGIVCPNELDFSTFLKEYKALVCHLLNPKYNYEKLVEGKAKVKTALLKKIMDAKSVAEVETLIDERHHILKSQQDASQKLVKKSKINLFRTLSIVFSIALLATGIWLGILLDNTIPRYERITQAYAAYVVNNFSEAVAIMRDDEPHTLPSSVQYMLASSYVQLEHLTSAQRHAILNNLSPNSSSQELSYWIFIGRGYLEYALDIAYVLGDMHLRLHAYNLLYDRTFADMDMPGNIKQQYLAEYRQEIENLLATLEGRDPVNVADTNPTNIDPDDPDDNDDTDNDEETNTNDTDDDIYI